MISTILLFFTLARLVGSCVLICPELQWFLVIVGLSFNWEAESGHRAGNSLDSANSGWLMGDLQEASSPSRHVFLLCEWEENRQLPVSVL